ncbi:prolyl-tRNA synthetase [Candidatus Parcubacteria bacterium]|nr:prolyl-tRNA synthetase [Candidatus Parcubacteria bacterium]
MKQSELFTKTLREAPKDERSISVQLLIRAGFVDKLAAGVYTFLPLGFRVLEKIQNIISQEIENIGGKRILMPVLVPKTNWQQTGRWKSFKELFKIKGKSDQEYGLGPTHEEVIAPLIQKYVSSYKDLPCYVYQIQTKFRDEIRVKSGILRTREFDMKDLYSFHRDENDLDRYYEKARKAYFNIFKRMGLKNKTYLTLASGGSFSKFSHEFQTITLAGEDIIHICQNCGLAINQEIKKDYPECPECHKKGFKKEKAIEIGNIFKLKTKYTKPFDFEFIDKDGSKKLVIMGCYGIGLTRLMGTIAEVHNDKNGIIWPKKVAPFNTHLIQIGNNNKVKQQAEKLYKDLRKQEVEVLYDDREDKSPGEKFADADLIGIPIRIVISERTFKRDCVELKKRNEKKIKLVKIKYLSQFLSSELKTQNAKP